MMISRRDALARLAAIGAAAFVLPLDGFERKAAKPFDHPDPRPGITSEKVLTPEKVGDKKKAVLEAYEYAREYPGIFDGIYCPCDCKKGMGHRSLLSCYETTQPTGCGSCQEVGELVGKAAKDGKSLAEIREAVDKKYG